MKDLTQEDIQIFIDRWLASGAAERANYQLFLSELCDIIEVEHPKPASENPHENSYVFEKSVPSAHGTTNFIDLYKRDCFVLEAKQGSNKQKQRSVVLSEAALRRKKQRKTGTAVRGTKAWDTAMEKARQQAYSYARNLTDDEITSGRPPFILVVDVGNTIALYSEFSRSGGNYIPFPDHSSYRIKLNDLQKSNVRQMLRHVWDDPMLLDPSQRSAKVTRKIAVRLAELAKSLEGTNDTETVSQFLMRCLFTMFAEDVELLPAGSFTKLLDDILLNPDSFKPMIEHLWATMDKGGFSVILRRKIPMFNGGLFADQTALPLTLQQIELLVEAAKADWRDVEPAIFGTLLERALDPFERHKLGAHYTPRAYVERLVQPTIIEPLRSEWESVQAAALLYAELEQTDKAIAEVEAFHRRLVTLRILDPACGSGNFLYVTMEHLKRLEGEVLNTMQELGEGQMKLEMSGVTVSPQQFLGIEVNPRASAIAELVLWIGYLQWHYRTRGNVPYAEPVISDFHNIECRDAVLAWDAVEPLLDENGQPVTRWDGSTTKLHPVTGEEVPDETAQIPEYKYIKPHKAEWPDSDYIVGNPPFIGDKVMRIFLGNEYVDTLRKTYKGKVTSSSDYVMYWWYHGAEWVKKGSNKTFKRFGFISTNSIRQPLNRKTIQKFIDAKPPISLTFAIPDHPWVDSADGADVRISMTVGKYGKSDGILTKVDEEIKSDGMEPKLIFKNKVGKIFSDLTVGVDVTNTVVLKSNLNIVTTGVQLSGTGFRLTRKEVLGLGYSLNNLPEIIRPYVIGRDLTRKLEERYVIDFYGYSLQEALKKYPKELQIVIDRVKSQRKAKAKNGNPDVVKYAEEWWLFAKTRSTFRPAFETIIHFIATCRTAKHRSFVLLDKSYLPDAKVVAIALGDHYYLGVLSSWIHVIWSLRNGGWLGVGNDSNYNHSDCFNKFPFPDATEEQKTRIRELAELLDTHRKRQLAQHPKLILTDMHNVLEKVRSGEPLNAKEQIIHEQGLISIFRQLHDDLDEAVFVAYGWPPTFTDEELLQHLVDLNAERAAEEANGHTRWLRAEYQAPDEILPQQKKLIEISAAPDTQSSPVAKQNWPKVLKDRVTAVRDILAEFDLPVDVKEVASGFNGRRTKKRLMEIEDILEMFVALGQVGEENRKYIIG